MVAIRNPSHLGTNTSSESFAVHVACDQSCLLMLLRRECGPGGRCGGVTQVSVSVLQIMLSIRRPACLCVVCRTYGRPAVMFHSTWYARQLGMTDDLEHALGASSPSEKYVRGGMCWCSGDPSILPKTVFLQQEMFAWKQSDTPP